MAAVPGFLVVAAVDGDVIEADGPAADIWAELAAPASVDDIAAVLAARCAAPVDTVRADVTRFVERLAAGGFVRVDA